MKCVLCDKESEKNIVDYPVCHEHYTLIATEAMNTRCTAVDILEAKMFAVQQAKRPKLDPTIKSNEIRVDLWDGIINGVDFGSGVPPSIVLSIVETDTNGLEDIEKDRILQNDSGDDCFIREWQDQDKKEETLDHAVDDLLSCTELNLDEMEPHTRETIKRVEAALARLRGPEGI